MKRLLVLIVLVSPGVAYTSDPLNSVYKRSLPSSDYLTFIKAKSAAEVEAESRCAAAAAAGCAAEAAARCAAEAAAGSAAEAEAAAGCAAEAAAGCAAEAVSRCAAEAAAAAEAEAGEEDQKPVFSELKWFRFADQDGQDPDSILGGLSFGTTGDAQSFRFNALNYNIGLGGNLRQPLQVYIGDVASNGSEESALADANAEKLLDPEAGIAIKFPFLWEYRSNGNGLCAFLKDEDSVGRCSFGADVTLNFKELEGGSGDSETAFGQTVRLVGALTFPVLDAKDDSEEGYVSIAARAVFAHTDIDDPLQLFQPVLDFEGNPIEFDDSIFAADLEVKLAINQKLAVSARWFKPLDNEDYLDDLFRITLQTQF